jgi:adenylate cyclase
VNAKLTINEPTGRSWQMDIDASRQWLIGRAKENDIVLNDRRVSRKHAFLTCDGGKFRIIDGYVEDGRMHRSVNHVYVNGSPRYEATLSDGDVINIGESRLEFSLQTQTERPAAVMFDDAPMGHTQLHISVKELIGGSSEATSSPTANPDEIKDLRRKAKILDLLFEMSKTLGTVFDLDEVFAKATDLIFRGTPADRVVALLATGDGSELYQVAARSRDPKFEALTGKLSVSRTITRKVMEDRIALLSQDAKTDQQFQGSESIVLQGVRSTICAPLVTQSDIYGVLYADRLDPFAAFSPDHLELISAVAAQVAITIQTVKVHERLAREEVARANYSRFLPEYVVQQILENPNSFRLGGVNQTVTVLFADIRGFTSVSEHTSPEKVVKLLNHYFSAMSEVIFEFGGTLDKYIGDGLMALFGAPTAGPNDARNAVTAAVEMQRRLKKLQQDPTVEGLAEIAVGIGLHTGVATVGYIGSERRSEYTAIGDTVNLASRLESNAKRGQILISGSTAEAAGDCFPMVRHAPLKVKNREQPVDVSEVIWAENALEPAEQSAYNL